jgi:hypothetical protein
MKKKFSASFASVQGSSHRKSEPQVPCQDSSSIHCLENGAWVLAVSDGAGSSTFSHDASRFCTDDIIKRLAVYDLSAFKETPINLNETKSAWHQVAVQLFNATRNSLLDKCKVDIRDVSEMHCTLILIIQTEWGFLSANIGDGRAGYFDGSPKVLTVPFQTFTAGATYFLIKEQWQNVMRSDVHVLEDSDNLEYFFASTDGPQHYIMDNRDEFRVKAGTCGVYDDILGKEAYYDYNRLFHPFFEGLINSLNELNTEEERNNRLYRLLDEGIYCIGGKETELKSLLAPWLDDDKTLVVVYNTN